MKTKLNKTESTNLLIDNHFSDNDYLQYIGYGNIYRHLKYMLIVLFGILLLTYSASSKNLEAKYNMYLLGTRIGEFSVCQTNNYGQVRIDAITDVNVNLLFSYCIKYIQHTVYNKGVLQSSHVETYKNEKLNSSMWLLLEKDSYRLIADGDTSILNDPITYSGSLLYFNEPLRIKKIFKERSMEMRQLSSENEHTYVIKDDKAKELNRYIYEDGILQYARMKHMLGTLELKRIKKNQVDD